MPHDLQDTWGMIADIFRETTPVVRWCFIAGLVAGVAVYVCILCVIASARFFIRSPIWYFLFLAFLVGGGIVGIGVGVGIEGLLKLLGRGKNKKHKRGHKR